MKIIIDNILFADYNNELYDFKLKMKMKITKDLYLLFYNKI